MDMMKRMINLRKYVIWILFLLLAAGFDADHPIAMETVSEIDDEDALASYQHLIDLYAVADTESWPVQQYRNCNLAWIYGAYDFQIGYCFADINDDGIVELLTGRPGQYGGSPKFGSFNALYTLVGDEPELLLERGEISMLFICSDGTVGMHSNSGDSAETWDYYTLPEGGNKLVIRERIGFDSELYKDENTWYRNSQNPLEHTGDELISQEEAMSLVDRYDYLSMSFKEIEAHIYDDETTTLLPFYGIWCLGTKDESEAQAYASWLTSMGYSAGVYLTTDWSNLNPEPWYVVSAGEYAGDTEAYDSLGWVQQVCGDAYVKWTGDYIGG